MDAVKFLEESLRMCKSHPSCDGCKMEYDNFGFPCDLSHELKGNYNYEKTVEIVEKWTEDHPKKTRQSEFLEHYPNASILGDGCINIQPCHIDIKNYSYDNETCEKFGDCIKCMKQYWMEEID